MNSGFVLLLALGIGIEPHLGRAVAGVQGLALAEGMVRALTRTRLTEIVALCLLVSGIGLGVVSDKGGHLVPVRMQLRHDVGADETRCSCECHFHLCLPPVSSMNRSGLCGSSWGG